VKIHIEVDREKNLQLKEMKEKDGRSVTWHVNRAIDNYLTIKKAAKNEQDTQ
jgi:predicted transcriptional regulator